MSTIDEVLDFVADHPVLTASVGIGIGLGAMYLTRRVPTGVYATLKPGKMILRYNPSVESVQLLAHAVPLTHTDVADMVMQAKDLFTIKDVILITEKL